MHSQQHGRGVLRARWTIDGYPVLYALKANGDRLKKIVVLREGVSEERAYRWLNELLDRLDPPRPQLHLVKPPTPRQIDVARLDALYRDASPTAALFWQRKREIMAGVRHPAPPRGVDLLR